MLTRQQYDRLRELIYPYMTEDKYGLHTICSIYFDTDDDRIIRNSLEKPLYKEKLRLRSYGVPESDDSEVFMELKKKYKGIVYKRRAAIALSEAESYIRSGKIPTDSQIFREIEYFRSYYSAYPKVLIAYDRIAMCGLEDNSLRMTFDFNIRCRRDELSLRAGDHGIRIIPDGSALLEIKISCAIPLWLSSALSQLKLYPVSFSKYGQFYTKELKGELKLCSTVS
ncbi:MAG: polyphosphate polymerase domain-containing protein [Oscillospiraceae bacterium]|nr:polyphosphate polymerase domain-containing protein [Oscillospiraceae bacterium]